MGRNQYWAGMVYDLCVYYMTGTPEGSTESGFMEKPRFEPATPGLQGIALIHYTTGASPRALYKFMFLWPCSLAVPVLAGWVFAFCGSMSHPLYPMIQPNFYIEELIQNTTSRARMDSSKLTMF